MRRGKKNVHVCFFPGVFKKNSNRKSEKNSEGIFIYFLNCLTLKTFLNSGFSLNFYEKINKTAVLPSTLYGALC